MPVSPLVEVVVDLNAIAHNVRQLQGLAEPADVMVVLKADAYNHGLGPVLSTVRAAGVRHVGVATLQEAVAVREDPAGGGAYQAGQPGQAGHMDRLEVLAWMWDPGQDLGEVIAAGVNIGIPSLAHAQALLRAATDYAVSPQRRIEGDAVPVRATLMVDTGLSRSGVSPAEWEATVDLLVGHRDVIEVTGLMSHLASADDTTDPGTTDRQAARFTAAIDYCRARGLDVPFNHLANTPATLNRPDTRHELVRVGVGVYGVDPVAPKSGVGLREAMTLRAQVITTRVVPAGEGVSYGHMWVAQEDTRTAVVAVGYADGLPRNVSGVLEVGINGRRYRQIGRVCMDQIVVSLGPADGEDPGVRPGDWAVLFGEGGMGLDEFAEIAGTIAYEVMTLPHGSRVARRYIGGSQGVAEQGIDLTRETGTVTVVTAEDMRECGRQLGAQLQAGTVVVLSGPLGAGKTTITQGIAAGLGVKGRVQSPTFTIVRTHKSGGGPGMLHMDAYRLLGADVQEGIDPGRYSDRHEILDALESLDIDADLDTDLGGVVVVAEWGRGVVEELSDTVLDVQIDRASAPESGPESNSESEVRTVTWKWVSQGA